MEPVVVMRSARPALRLEAPLSEEEPRLTGGYASWQETARPRRVALTDYVGRSPFRQTVPILLDGFATGASVEPAIRTLEKMALPGSGRADPPVLTLAGPLPRVEGDWVVETIEWGQALRDDDGNRIRQAATISLLELVEDERLKELNRRRPSRPRWYVVKRGDTLRSIAAHQLGKASRWHEIARLNHIRRLQMPRDVGKRLRLP